jgi:hypothetical protein
MKMKTNKPRINARQFKRVLMNATLQLQRPGVRLCRMNSKPGPTWFLLPGGIIDDNVAAALIALPNVVAGKDGLLPHHDQTWRIASSSSASAAA